jgi:ADP-ribose pyrophosphatase YjhB (NUDIX family)
MFNYCPSCASKKITFEEGKVFRCPDCSFIFYHNNAAATGCLIVVGDKFVFTVRAKEPAAGKLDMPGGFVDIGEGAIECLYREMREEIGWTPPVPDGAKLIDVFKFYASFSNVYEYKGIKYNTCDLYFSVTVPDLKPEDLKIDENEIAAVRFLRPEEIDFSEFAFPSTIKALKTYLKII